MAKYTSRYAELGFYVNGELKRFSNGEYSANDEAEITVLDALVDAVRVDEPEVTKEDVAETKVPEEDATETKEPEVPAAAPKAPRRSSAK